MITPTAMTTPPSICPRMAMAKYMSMSMSGESHCERRKRAMPKLLQRAVAASAHAG